MAGSLSWMTGRAGILHGPDGFEPLGPVRADTLATDKGPAPFDQNWDANQREKQKAVVRA